MRTTLDIDGDVLQAVEDRVRRERRTADRIRDDESMRSVRCDRSIHCLRCLVQRRRIMSC